MPKIKKDDGVMTVLDRLQQEGLEEKEKLAGTWVGDPDDDMEEQQKMPLRSGRVPSRGYKAQSLYELRVGRPKDGLPLSRRPQMPNLLS